MWFKYISSAIALLISHSYSSSVCSVQFSHSDSLPPHGLQHTRPPCPSPTPGAYSNSCPSSQWCHPTTSSSVIPFSSRLHSFLPSGSFQMALSLWAIVISELYFSIHLLHDARWEAIVYKNGDWIQDSSCSKDLDSFVFRFLETVLKTTLGVRVAGCVISSWTFFSLIGGEAVQFDSVQSLSGVLWIQCNPYIDSVQFSHSCPTLWDPMNHSTPGLLVHHQLPEFTQTHVHWVGDAIQPSHPLLSPSPPAPNPSQHQGLFQWVNSSFEVAKVLEFQPQHQSFQWTPRTGLL